MLYPVLLVIGSILLGTNWVCLEENEALQLWQYWGLFSAKLTVFHFFFVIINGAQSLPLIGRLLQKVPFQDTGNKSKRINHTVSVYSSWKKKRQDRGDEDGAKKEQNNGNSRNSDGGNTLKSVPPSQIHCSTTKNAAQEQNTKNDKPRGRAFVNPEEISWEDETFKSESDSDRDAISPKDSLQMRAREAKTDLNDAVEEQLKEGGYVARDKVSNSQASNFRQQSRSRKAFERNRNNCWTVSLFQHLSERF